jgi:hypothetical protein
MNLPAIIILSPSDNNRNFPIIKLVVGRPFLPVLNLNLVRMIDKNRENVLTEKTEKANGTPIG